MTGFKFLQVVLVTLLCSTVTYAQQNYTLSFKSLELTPEVSSDFNKDLASLDRYQGKRYGIIQFLSIPNQEVQLTLEQRGIQLLEYMPNLAYFVAVDDQAIEQDWSGLGIRSVLELPYVAKLQPELVQLPYPEHALEDGLLMINIKLHEGINPAHVVANIEYLAGSVEKVNEKAGLLRAYLPPQNLRNLGELAAIQYIEPIDAPGEPENDRAAATHRVSALSRTTTGLSKDLNGEGIHVMLQDDGIIGPHIDYQGRIGMQYVNFNTGDHGDHTGGTIMAAGNLNPKYQGMAPASILYVYGAAGQGYPGFDSAYSHYNKHEIRITSTSYSNGCNAGYTSLARELDVQTNDMEDLTHVFSAGNSGTSNCGYGAGQFWGNITGGHKVAKNVITVGNLNHLDQINTSSSRGPAADGRIKPDVTAVGTDVMSTTNDHNYVRKTGTSMSCPGVSGTMAVLYQAFKEHNSNQYPDATLMKGILCNTADDLGEKGADFVYGFGRVNARKAYKVIESKNYKLDSLSNGDSMNITVQVPGNQPGSVRFMLVWNDPPGAVGSSNPLVNDLDIRVSEPLGQSHLPLVPDHNPANVADPAIERVDRLNNIEQVVIDSPLPGNYQVTIKAHQIPMGKQSFYLTWWVEEEAVVLEYPVGGEKWVPSESETIRWSAPDGNDPFDIELSLDSGNSWTVLANVPPNQRYYQWTVPSGITNTGKAIIRIINGNLVDESELFSIMHVPTAMSVERACPDTLKLRWIPTPGATHYTVYRLGAKYMDSIATTTNPNVYITNNYHPYTEYWFAVSAHGPDDAVSRRSEAIRKAPGLLNCQLDEDLELVEFVSNLSTVQSCSQGSDLEVTVKVKNAGGVNSSNFDLILDVNGNAVTETFNLPIAPGTDVDYTFTHKPTLSIGPNDIEVTLDYSPDQNVFNDTLDASVDMISGVTYSACHRTDFENFTNCGTESDCGAEVCDLIDGWLNEANDVVDDIDWRVNSGTTPSNSTGPVVDHTTTSPLGKYLYLEASGCYDHEAHLISPCIDLSNAYAPKLSFWYHMNGSNMGTLSGDILVDGAWVEDIFTPLTGNKGGSWLNQEVDLSAYVGKVIQIRLVGRTGNNFRSDMALDDINFIDAPLAGFEWKQQNGFTVDFTDTSKVANSWSWDFGDGGTDTVANPTHNYGQNGIFLVKLKVENECGVDSVQRGIQIFETSVTEWEGNDALSIYPVPMDQQLHVDLSEWPAEVGTIRLVDPLGRTVASSEVNGQSLVILQVDHLRAGTYILELESEAQVVRRTLIHR
ncbi:S8 family serine peptidase [bacterium SCSIO 12741]|nr:S8 family serine peptidase [bacterium SCSIO 12741]